MNDPRHPNNRHPNRRTRERSWKRRPACRSGIDEKELLARYGERTLEAADPIRHIGLRELVAECARLEGIDVPRVFGDGTATIRAGFSTMSLPAILENVMNKTLLAAYRTRRSRRSICVASVPSPTSRKSRGTDCLAPADSSRSLPTAN